LTKRYALNGIDAIPQGKWEAKAILFFRLSW